MEIYHTIAFIICFVMLTLCAYAIRLLREEIRTTEETLREARREIWSIKGDLAKQNNKKEEYVWELVSPKKAQNVVTAQQAKQGYIDAVVKERVDLEIRSLKERVIYLSQLMVDYRNSQLDIADLSEAIVNLKEQVGDIEVRTIFLEQVK